MKNKMYVVTLNEKGTTENSDDIEYCTLNNFARDYLLATNQNNVEIGETKNGNVYIKYINSANNKIYMVNLYVLKNTKMNELKEDFDEIKTELIYRNED